MGFLNTLFLIILTFWHLQTGLVMSDSTDTTYSPPNSTTSTANNVSTDGNVSTADKVSTAGNVSTVDNSSTAANFSTAVNSSTAANFSTAGNGSRDSNESTSANESTSVNASTSVNISTNGNTSTSGNVSTVANVSTVDNVSTVSNASFMIKSGVVFPVSQTYSVSYGDSECNCMNLCKNDPRCQHCCWISNISIGWCRLTDQTFPQVSQLSRGIGRTAFMMPKFVFLGKDKLFYFTVDKLMTYSDATAACHSQMNFKIGIYKSQVQWQFLKNIHSNYSADIWVDMKLRGNISNVKAVWADGTPFLNTEISQFSTANFQAPNSNQVMKFRFNGNDFYGTPMSTDTKFGVLCQE